MMAQIDWLWLKNCIWTDEESVYFKILDVYIERAYRTPDYGILGALV